MKKLAIVGSHPDTRGNAPWDDPEFEIWVFNEAAQADWCKRWDACFQLHKEAVYTSPHNFSNRAHWDWLQRNHGADKIVWMQSIDPRVPNSQPYPLDAFAILGARVNLAGEYVTWVDSTPSYALALALYLGYGEIHVWGVELSSNTEYYRQLPNWTFWVGVAHGMGVHLVLHCGAVHFTAPLYGYEGETQLPTTYFEERAALLDGHFASADRGLKRLKDRIDEAILSRKIPDVARLMMEMRDSAIHAGQFSGAKAEADICLKRARLGDPIPRQEMERRAAQAQKDGESKSADMYHAGGKLEYVFNVWVHGGQMGALQQMRELLAESLSLAFDVGAMSGIYRENLQYMTDLDRLTDAAGGEKTLAALSAAEAAQ